jgi:hypothetical protein
MTIQTRELHVGATTLPCLTCLTAFSGKLEVVSHAMWPRVFLKSHFISKTESATK